MLKIYADGFSGGDIQTVVLAEVLPVVMHLDNPESH